MADSKKNAARVKPDSLGSIKKERQDPPTPSPSRLPSLRGPKDLTLGGIKKRTFAPIIPARKGRVKSEKVEDTPDKGKQRSKRDRSHDRGRGRGRGRGGRGRGFQQKEIIQSHSIFEAGPSGEQIRKGGASGSFGAEPAPTIQRPTIKRENLNVDLAQEKAESEAVMKKLDEGNSSFIEGLSNDEKLKPVNLPIFNSSKVADVKPSILVNPNHCSHLFTNEDKLILFQIPDTLPGVPPSRDDEMLTETKENEDKTLEICSLDQFSEGHIGKLQVLRSGRCRIKLGEVVMDLKMGTPSGYSEEIVSVRLPPEGNPEGSKGHMTILGNVEDKIICVPNLQSLIQNPN